MESTVDNNDVVTMLDVLNDENGKRYLKWKFDFLDFNIFCVFLFSSRLMWSSKRSIVGEWWEEL